jgi:hypothetical protein
MSKKLLNETQIRRFQQLAKVPALSEAYGMMGDRDEDESADPVGADPMDDAMDVPAPDGMEPEADGEVVLSSEDAQRVADALPAMEKIAAAVGDDAGDDDMGAMDDMGDLGDDDAAGMPAGDMGGDDDELMEALHTEGIEMLDEGEIVDAVIKRVAARLVSESRRQRKDRKLEALAEKIVSRITTND